MEKLNPPVYFGEWVKLRRKALDLTQADLAQRSGCSTFTVRKIESGERRPSKQLAELLAISLEIPPENKHNFIRIARGELSLEWLLESPPDTPLPAISGFQPDQGPSTIPLQPTPLVGRNPELTAMERLFSDPQCRLLSLTGLGGIGKTRLVIEFANRQLSVFDGGVYYVPLAPIKFAKAIVPVVADAVGFVFSGPTDPKEQIINFIGKQLSQSVLLVFDNLEHLLVPSSADEVVALITEFLQRLPNVKILTTSRERLNLQGEWTYELYGLAVPPSDYSGGLDDYSATALFMQSAKRVKVVFEVSGGEKQAVIQICRLLVGIPLAIELAAAWVGVLSCQEIAQEINSNIDFLTTTMHDIPERHRSIRASFDHSWHLLSRDEQGVLSKLSVFNGGFDRYAAEQITRSSLLLLASLVSKSLIHRTESGRYDLHDVVRQFAFSHLKNDPLNQETYERHAEYYLAYIQDYEESLKSAPQQEAILQLTGEIANIRAAWRWAINHRKYVRLGQVVRSFGWYYEVTGLYREGLEQLELFAKAIRDEYQGNQVLLRTYGVIMIHQALLYFRKGEFRRAQDIYEESITLLRQIGDPSLLADPLVFLGILLHLSGDYIRSKSLMEEGLQYARSSNEKWFEAYAVYNLGYIASLMGDYEKGYEQMLFGLDLWRALGDPTYIALGLNFLVPTLNEMGRHEEAVTFMQESIALSKQTKNRWGLGTAYHCLGSTMMSMGEVTEAQNCFRKSLEIFSDYTTGWDIALPLAYLGEAAMMAGDISGSRKLFMDALPHATEANAIPIILDIFLGLAQIESKTGDNEKSLTLLTYILNNPASTQKTKDRALALVSEIIKMLKDPQVKAAREDARNLSIEEIVKRFIQR